MFSSQERVIHCLHEVSEQTIDTPTKHQKLDEIDAYKNPVVVESQCKIGILKTGHAHASLNVNKEHTAQRYGKISHMVILQVTLYGHITVRL